MIAACGSGTALETLASIPRPLIEMQMSRDRR
jgi:hypothetical protein